MQLNQAETQEMTNTRGVTLVWGDGGIKGGFIAAAADEVVHFLRESDVPIKVVMASSASVGNMFYFLSTGYDHPGFRMWTEVLARKDFINFEGISSLYGERPIYDVDYLVDHIFRKEFPLDIERIKKTEISIYFPVQDFDTGEIVYFSNRRRESFFRNGKEIKVRYIFDYDLYDLIKAASAAPFVYDRPVQIGENRYIDAASVEPFTLDLPEGNQYPHIIILTKSEPTYKSMLFYIVFTALWCVCVLPFRKTKLKLRNYLSYALKPIASLSRYKKLRFLEAKGQAVLISPSGKIGSNFDNSPKTLRDNYLHGQEAGREGIEKLVRILNLESETAGILPSESRTSKSKS